MAESICARTAVCKHTICCVTDTFAPHVAANHLRRAHTIFFQPVFLLLLTHALTLTCCCCCCCIFFAHPGCDGGSIDAALQYMIDTGATFSDQYPFVSCKALITVLNSVARLVMLICLVSAAVMLPCNLHVNWHPMISNGDKSSLNMAAKQLHSVIAHS
jgi:hypothetical protein